MKFDEVEFGAVAFVLAETIFGEARAKFTHQTVASHFCDHTGSGDRETDAIAIDNSRLRQGKGRHWKSINEDVLGNRAQRLQREPHRFVCRPEDVDLIDLNRVYDPDAPKNVIAPDQLIVNFLTQLWQQLFRILQFPMAKFLR